MRKIFCLIILFAICFSMLATVKAQSYLAPPTSELYPISLGYKTLFTPMVMTVTFQYTQNITSNAYPSMGGAYDLFTSMSAGQSSITFATNALDTFTVTIEARYAGIVNQTVIVSFSTGNNTVSLGSFPFSMDSPGFILTLTLETIQQPEPATPAQVWEYGYQSYETLIHDTNLGLITAINNQSATLGVVGIVSFSSLGISVFCVWMIIRHAKKEAMQDAIAKQPYYKTED